MKLIQNINFGRTDIVYSTDNKDHHTNCNNNYGPSESKERIVLPSSLSWGAKNEAVIKEDNLDATQQEEGNTELEWTLKKYLVNNDNINDTDLKWILKTYRVNNNNINTYSEEWLLKRYRVNNDNTFDLKLE